jgi:hypothetical protein
MIKNTYDNFLTLPPLRDKKYNNAISMEDALF